MKATRRLLSLALCVALLLGLVSFAQAEGKDLKTFRLFVISWGDPPQDAQMVFDKINEKLLADGMDFQLEFNYVNSEVWEAKLNMMLSTGESFDAFIGMQDMIDWSTYRARGAIAPVTQYMDQYGAHLKEMIPSSAFSAMTADGELWGIPCYGSSIASNSEWITVRKDLFDKYYNGKTIETYDDLLGYIKAIYENCGGQIWPKVISDGGSYLHRAYETYPFTVYAESIYIDQSGNVKAWVDTEEFKKDAEFWFTCVENGWASPDILTIDEQTKRDGLFFNNGSLRTDISTSAITPTDLKAENPEADLEAVLVNPAAGYFNSTGINHCWMVPVTSEHPELAVRFFDWLYSSQENHDMLLYGIKGTHWQEETATLSYGGITRNCISKLSTNYAMSFWALGNMHYKRYTTNDFASTMNSDMHILYGDKPELEGAALGFVFDTTSVETEWVNVQAEITASLYPIKYGIVSYEDGFADMRARLTAASIDKVVEEYQKQLNAYLGK